MIRALAGNIKRIHRSITVNGLSPYSTLVSTATLIHPTSSEIRQLSWKSTVAQTSFSELQDDIDMTRNEIDNAVPDPNDPTVGYTKESNPSQENSGRMTTAEFRKLHHIRIKNEGEGNEYAPFESFDCAPFPSQLKRLLLKQGYTAPTPTQAQSWPIVLAKRDIISIARTGSGKVLSLYCVTLHNSLICSLCMRLLIDIHGYSHKLFGSVHFPLYTQFSTFSPS